MTIAPAHTLQPLLKKLQLWHPFDQAEREALLALPFQRRQYRAREMMVRQLDRPKYCCLLLDGYAIRHKMTSSGARQIFSIHMRGDFVDLHNSLLQVADHNVEALTVAEVALVPVQAVRDYAANFPGGGRAMWHETLVDSSIFREWTLNVGRRTALARTAHLLCEFSLRMARAGLGDSGVYALPMTQEQLGDALGLTSVHVNRTLRTLREQGLIDQQKRSIRICDFGRLAQVGDFDPHYLHFTDPPPERRD